MALSEEAQRIVAKFDYTNEDVNEGVQEFLRQMKEGLEKDGTSLSQIPTYVTSAPNGTEKGLYLAVDLGGTNFRVCSVLLGGDSTFNLTATKVAIPKDLMVAESSKPLFQFLAKQVEEFLRTHHDDHFQAYIQRRKTLSSIERVREEEIFHLGFTFSFPVQQLAINKGTLIRWTKGFDIPEAVGKDVCKLLQDAIDDLHLPVKVSALVNDTVGTLMTRSYTSPGKESAILGAIFGTGTNGAYIEKMDKIKKPVQGSYDKSTGLMVVNTEWGSFDNQLNHLPDTPYDTQLDKESLNPGLQMYEKRVSGMFLGEICRLALLDLVKDPAISLFKNDSQTTVAEESGLNKQWGLDSALLSTAAEDESEDLSKLKASIEKELKIFAPSLEDLKAFRDVSAAVVRRAAKLSAVPIGAIVLDSGNLETDEIVDIGVDGSLVEYYPKFRDMVMETLASIEGIGEAGAKKIRIGIAKDGSGVGAALIALVATRME
ncbi:Glucokinase [Zalerion maritima]|uniref:Phosphotransferase n=1 Tax=Zalerion maritima TaxID=339359 RepID=A0AAD5WUU9_9PEZI|nr:Glucokinase [Zalerion maritima]